MRISGSIGTDAIRGNIRRKNSRNAAVLTGATGRIRNEVRCVPMNRIPRCATAPATAPQAVAMIPKRAAKSTVPRMIPAVYRTGAGVEQEPSVGDEDLAEGHRGREQDLGEGVDPDQLDVQLAGLRVEPATDDLDRATARR